MWEREMKLIFFVFFCFLLLFSFKYPELKINQLCLSDGGEGWLESLKTPLQLDIHTVPVTGPYLDMTVNAIFGYNSQMKLAVIEMASACGMNWKKQKCVYNCRVFSTHSGVF